MAATMRAGAFILMSILLAGCERTQPAPASPAPGPRLLLVSVDGLRPDVMLRAHAPNMKALIGRGTSTMWAQSTVDMPLTIPGHASMLTGTAPWRHWMWWDEYPSRYNPPRPPVPTILELARQHGYSTAMATGKSKLAAIVRPDTPHWVFVPGEQGYADDLNVGRQAASIIEQHRPQVMFVHFPDCDAAGHGSGWGSTEQVQTVERTDGAIGLVLAAMRRAGVYESTTIIVTADHGGSGKGHWKDDPYSIVIPWIIAGPGIRSGVDLTSEPGLAVKVEDTFVTACVILNLPVDEDTDGKFLSAAFIAEP